METLLEVPIQQIKNIYKESIEKIISESVSSEGLLDVGHARESIAHLWFHHFMIHYANLNLASIDEVWDIFDSTIDCLDSCENKSTVCTVPKKKHNAAYF